MAIKDILVHLDTTPRSAARLAVAATLAARHGAHLTGLHVIDVPPPDVLYGFPSAYLDVQRADEIIDQLRAARLGEAGPVQDAFNERLRLDGLHGEWRTVEGITDEVVALHARYADFAVLGQPDPTGWRGAEVSPTALMGSGRPILVVPYAGEFPTVGRRVLVGWNASPEAARAVAEAMPLLQAADKVTVLSINPRGGIGGDGAVPAADIALHMARHGIQAEAAHTVASDIPEGEALLSYAVDIGADLLVCGMYGHSRFREFAFGGVTRGLLAHMTLPVFMSH